MSIRKRILPPGWYPGSEQEVKRTIHEWEQKEAPAFTTGIAGVVPHAGWMFSGELACKVFRHLASDVETVVIIGGHLPPNGGIYAAKEDGYETPLGDLSTDKEVLSGLEEKISLKNDTFSDNTVEVQLPFVKYYFPKATGLGLRVEPTEQAVSLGKAVADVAQELGKKIAVVGSTDLTHYGLSYGFAPHGSGEEAVRWVKEVNDKNVIDALLAFDYTKAVKRGVEDKAACSVGAAVAAASFASSLKEASSTLLDYYTSRRIHKAESFVGYAGIVYS